MNLLEMNTHQFAETEIKLCFWPVGTIEAHDLGPLGTDVIAPEKLARDLASAFNALLLPTLPYGLVSSMAGYRGSMWMSDQTYRDMVFELLGSLTASGVEMAILFNGHGGNTEALSQVLPRLSKERGMRCACIDWWTVGADLSEEHFGSAGGHGGADELALVGAAIPGLMPQTWDGSRAYTHRPGVKVCPSPRSAIRYSTHPPKPLTAESALAYYEALRERIRQVIEEILAGWAAL